MKEPQLNEVEALSVSVTRAEITSGRGGNFVEITSTDAVSDSIGDNADPDAATILLTPDECAALHTWLGRALGLPDLAQMQRRVESLLAMLEPLPDAMYEARAHIYERDCMGSTDEGARAIRAELKERATALEAALKELKS